MSNKNLTNNQLLLKEIISQEYEDNNQFASLDTFFELFSAGQILKDYAFSNEEIESGLTGGGNDGGCDTAYVLLNNEIITSDQIESLDCPKGSSLQFIIIQSKNTLGFGEDAIMKWKTGFIYDFKDVDYTQTAYNLTKKYGYPHKFYYVSFDKPERSYRFNPLKVVKDRTELMQLMEDVLLALLPKGEKQNEWVAGGLGILRGVAFRFWDEFPEYCTLPHIMAFIMTASTKQLSIFLQQNLVAEMMAGAYLKAEGSEKTQASYLSTLCNNLSTISQNEEIAYILSGDDFDFNLIDPEDPKLFAISNNFSKNSVYAPVIGMLMSISTRQFTMQNKVPFVYFLDEMTTVNIKNFETLPSVLREYKVGFVLLTQSGAKLEALYGKLDRASVEANFGIQFFGRTKDVEALKYYPQMFGKEEKERKSRSTGKSGSSSNRSVTISSQKEDIYQGRDFADLEPGEFIGSATRANVRYFKVMLGEFKEKDEKPLPDVRVLEPGEISGNFARILEEVRSLFPCE